MSRKIDRFYNLNEIRNILAKIDNNPILKSVGPVKDELNTLKSLHRQYLTGVFMGKMHDPEHVSRIMHSELVEEAIHEFRDLTPYEIEELTKTNSEKRLTGTAAALSILRGGLAFEGHSIEDVIKKALASMRNLKDMVKQIN